MNVLPTILSYGTINVSDNCIATPVDNSSGVVTCDYCPTPPSPTVVCATGACPIILNAECVFYEGPDLIYTKINTNDTVQQAFEKIETFLSEGNSTTSGTSGTSGTMVERVLMVQMVLLALVVHLVLQVLQALMVPMDLQELLAHLE